MKKILTVFAALAMVAGLASSCQKEGVSTDNPAQGELVQVNLTAVFEGDSKVTYSETDNILTPAWEMDDAILVINPSVDPSTLTVTSIDGNHATLVGSAEPGLVHLVYKKGITTGDWQDNKIDVDYDGQSINDDMPAVMFADGQVSSNGSGSFTFRNAGAVIGIYNAKGVPAESAISKVTLSGSNLSAATVSINGNALVLTATEKDKDAISTETLSDITVATGDTRALSKEILIAVPAGAKVEKVTLTVGEDTYSYTLAAAKTCNANDYLYVKTQQFKKDVVLPKGALPGVFTVSDPDGTPNSGDEKKVHFSKGNLYYDGSNWGFEEEQYYFRTYCDGTNNGGKCDADGYSWSSGTASGHWGLFRWSTEGKNFGMSTSTFPFDYSGNFVDWGTAIDDKGTWTTLSGGSKGEWKYLFDHHINVWGTCNSVPGRFIAHDGFVGGEFELSEAIQDWESAQAAGIVFFPAAGYLDNVVNSVGDKGIYWSSTAFDDDIYEINAYRAYLYSQYVGPDYNGPRCDGYSVRLITECQ